jgi:hypothetical protein
MISFFRRNRSHIAFFLCLPALISHAGDVAAETCSMAKDGFAVAQPYMVTRGCFLFYHAINIDLVNQSDLIITRKEELHPDPIHSEFLSFILDRKLIGLKKDTRLFSCDYDLPTVAKDFRLSGSQAGNTRTLGYELPEFGCGAVTSLWAPVRPIGESKCFWVAVPLIRCDEYGSELNEINVEGSLTEEE